MVHLNVVVNYISDPYMLCFLKGLCLSIVLSCPPLSIL